MTGGGRDSPSGIVHHVAAPVERHLRLVLWIVWRVVIVAGVVEVLRGSDTVLGVEARLLPPSGRLATSLGRGDGGRHHKCRQQTDQHQTRDAVEQNFDVEQDLVSTAVRKGRFVLGLIRALCNAPR